MRKIIVALFIFSMCCGGSAQIPNNSFENWTVDGGGNQNPDYWTSPNDQSGGYVPVLQATGNSGSFGMRVYTPNVSGFNVIGTCLLQFASTIRPIALTGYSKGTFVSNDSSYINITSSENMNGVGSGVKYFSTNQATYTTFSVPINYANANIPDTISIIVSSGVGINSPGADLTIDDLMFTMTAGIEMPLNSALITGGGIDVNQNYIFYINPIHPSQYTIRLMDVTGHMALEECYKLNAGKYPISIPIESIATGVYVLQIFGGQIYYSQKVLINH